MCFHPYFIHRFGECDISENLILKPLYIALNFGTFCEFNHFSQIDAINIYSISINASCVMPQLFCFAVFYFSRIRSNRQIVCINVLNFIL